MTTRRYILTRPEEHAAPLAAALRSIGIEPLEVPAVAIVPPRSWDVLDGAVRGITGFDWVLLTSRTGVEALFGRAGEIEWPATLRWAAIGPGTAQALRAHGIQEVWTPSRFLSEAVAAEMPVARGERVLRVRAAQASALPTGALRARGAQVTEVTAYRTIEAPAASRERLRAAWARGVEGVLFTSASTVRGFLRLATETGLRAAVAGARLVAIGPVTGAALEAAGLRPWAVAAEHSASGLIETLRGRSDEDAARLRAT